VECKCGCGETVVSTASFRPGHDQKLRIALEQRAGGLEALRDLVAAAERGHVRDQREVLLDWYERMVACVVALPPDERADIEEWDKQRRAGFRTSDWPGFEKYLPKRP
jgi:hypothetical protein